MIVSAPALLIAKQPDFGTAFLFLLIFITIMLTARLKLKTLAAILGLAAIAAFPIYQHLLREYQRKRFESFFDLNSEGAYQTRQALNAIGSGRLFGKGFMHGTQVRLRHFPALWTDFPFAVWAEEWGFFGCLAPQRGRAAWLSLGPAQMCRPRWGLPSRAMQVVVVWRSRFEKKPTDRP